MKLQINNERITFYLWTTSAYLLLWLIVDLAQHPESFVQYAVNEIWRAFYMLLVMFLLFEYTIPRFNKKNKIKSILLLAIQIFLFSFGLYAWRYLGIELHLYTEFVSYSSCQEGVGDQFGSSVFAILFFGVIRHFYNYRKLRLDAQQLKIDKQEAELNYLKSQTNPHFLFNTLNNIYSLARDKSDLAPESILRLSKILRFMLYETKSQFIAIEQELKIINDYIALEKLRYDKSLNVNFNYNIEDMKQSIPPLLLIPLVENAFKHGVSETRRNPFIDIYLSIKDRQLTFIVKNSYDSQSRQTNVIENIGLSNLRRQLELLYTQFNLSVQPEESIFTSILKINLASNV